MVTETPTHKPDGSLEFLARRPSGRPRPVDITAGDEPPRFSLGDDDRPRLNFVDEARGPGVGQICAGCAVLVASLIATGFLFAVGQTLCSLAFAAVLHIPIID